MKPIKHLYMHFQDGQRLARFPQQSSDPVEVARAAQADGVVVRQHRGGRRPAAHPRESIKYMQISPAPPALPEQTIIGAEMIN